MLGFWFGLQAFNSYSSFGSGEESVAHLAHVGGFVAGVVLILPKFLALGGPTFWGGAPTACRRTPPPRSRPGCR